jgi:hypothetical protein
VKELEIRNIITIEDKKILWEALEWVNGWVFNPIAVAVKDIEDYYFVCNAKSVINDLKMKIAKVHIKLQESNSPRLLSINYFNTQELKNCIEITNGEDKIESYEEFLRVQ